LKAWILAAIFAAGTGTAALLGDEYRLLNAAAAASIIGAASFVAYTRKQINSKVSFVVLVVGVIGAIATLIVHTSKQNVCTAVNASGERVVIGTELTDQGRLYKQNNPADDNNAILESLGGRDPDLAWTSESIRQCRIALALSGALWIPLFGVAAVAVVSVSKDSSRVAKPVRLHPRAFISYNHDDTAAALRVKQLLEKHGVEVIIDADSMLAGEHISEFIRRSILDSDVVISIISSRSLNSAWVASETIGSINRNKWGEEVTLIACYLDDQWFQPEFRLECTKKIDERLQRIEQLISEYPAQKLDSSDLNDEKTRLYDLRNNLGTILAAFKDLLCLDIRDDQFDESGRRLVNTIRSRRKV
jgi:threonine dehydrogenase-like Zn-dependent dehydrogenase